MVVVNDGRHVTVEWVGVQGCPLTVQCGVNPSFLKRAGHKREAMEKGTQYRVGDRDTVTLVVDTYDVSFELPSPGTAPEKRKASSDEEVPAKARLC